MKNYERYGLSEEIIVKSGLNRQNIHKLLNIEEDSSREQLKQNGLDLTQEEFEYYQRINKKGSMPVPLESSGRLYKFTKMQDSILHKTSNMFNGTRMKNKDHPVDIAHHNLVVLLFDRDKATFTRRYKYHRDFKQIIKEVKKV